MTVRIITGDCRLKMREMPEKSVHMCVTSPPYFGLRDYKIEPSVWGGDEACEHDWSPIVRVGGGKQDGNGKRWQHMEGNFVSGHAKAETNTCAKCGAWLGVLGLEPTPEIYVAHVVEVFREVRRVLRDDGTLWLNLGDSYAASRSYQVADNKHKAVGASRHSARARPPSGLKEKDLIGIPWMVAFALRADGWYLRQDIIWCLSGGTWLHAKTAGAEGPAMLKDLARLKPETVKLWNGHKWTQVLGWSRSASAVEKIELVLRSGERVGCTGSHLWPTERGLIQARNLRRGDALKSCRLPAPESKRPGYVTQQALWFAGLYLAEGNQSKKCVQMSLHRNELHLLEPINDVARHFGGSITSVTDGNNLTVRVYGRAIRSFLDNYIGGRISHDKHLAAAAWALPDLDLRILITGYLAGDAHDDEHNGRYRLGFCRNYHLERDLRAAAARLGATLTLKPTTAKYQGGRKPSFRGEWRWDRSGHHNERNRNEIVAIRKSRARQFWDIGVADEPHTFALASGVLTHNSKPAPMPESVTDRCTKSHEYIFLLAKSPRYFCDMEAIAEPASRPEEYIYDNGLNGLSSDVSHAGSGSSTRKFKKGVGGWATGPGNHSLLEHATEDGRENSHHHAVKRSGNKERKPGSARGCPENTGSNVAGSVPWEGVTRNKRSVWTVNTKPFPEAHFATFPPDLIEPCILAGTSAHGCCSVCGAQWVRVVEAGAPDLAARIASGGDAEGEYHGQSAKHAEPQAAPFANGQKKIQNASEVKARVLAGMREQRTVGWRPTCTCDAPPGFRADDLEVVESPASMAEDDRVDPSMEVGRAGMARERRADEGTRPITRYEQRHYAKQLKASPHAWSMSKEVGAETFAHYVRTDRAGARPILPKILEAWIERGHLTRVVMPTWTPPPVVPCTVLDPFGGAGTTAVVSDRHHRDAVIIDMSPTYTEISRRRVTADSPLFSQVTTT